jgi:hypothetical protein
MNSTELKEDLLGRQDQLDGLYALTQASGFDSRITYAVNAPYGYGKTHFLEMFKDLLEEKQEAVVYFNAWENDFSPNAYTALVAHLIEALEDYLPEETNAQETLRSHKENLKALEEKASHVGIALLKKTPQILASVILAHVAKNESETVRESLAEVFSEGMNTEAEPTHLLEDDLFQNHLNEKRVREAFKEQLSKFVEETLPKKKLYIIVDELERCKPSFAMELLEHMKHLFAVKGVVFIIGTHKAQLQHMVQKLYGPGFDGKAYLERLIPYEFPLNPPKYEKFVEYTWNSLKPEAEADTQKELREVITFYAEHFELALRDVQHITKDVVDLFSTAPADMGLHMKRLMVWLLFIKRFHNDVYDRLRGKETTYRLTDEELADLMGNRHSFILLSIGSCLLLSDRRHMDHPPFINTRIDGLLSTPPDRFKPEENIKFREIQMAFAFGKTDFIKDEWTGAIYRDSVETQRVKQTPWYKPQTQLPPNSYTIDPIIDLTYLIEHIIQVGNFNNYDTPPAN